MEKYLIYPVSFTQDYIARFRAFLIGAENEKPLCWLFTSFEQLIGGGDRILIKTLVVFLQFTELIKIVCPLC